MTEVSYGGIQPIQSYSFHQSLSSWDLLVQNQRWKYQTNGVKPVQKYQ